MRKPFQGVINIIRFNWPIYLITLIEILLLLTLSFIFPKEHWLFHLFLLSLIAISITLVSSWYIYDAGNLYSLQWINDVPPNEPLNILNIHAGFDETSDAIERKYRGARLKVYDFYHPQKHTEPSIRRARALYPSLPGTIAIDTANIPESADSIDRIFVIFSAHEIRKEEERIIFLQELQRVVKPDGYIFIVEHLRDTANFLVYNIGAYHFYSKQTWLNNFDAAGLQLEEEKKFTPFISCFKLSKNGTAS